MQLASLLVVQTVIAVVALRLTAWAWPRRSTSAGGGWLVAMCAAIALWSIGSLAEALLADATTKEVASTLQWVATVIAPPAYLMLVAAYTGSTALGRGWARRAVLATTGVALLVVLTNSAHGLVWDGAEGGTASGRGYLDATWGPAFPLLVALAYAYAAAGVYALARAFMRAPDAYRATAMPVLAAGLLPFVASVAVFTGPPGLASVLLTGAFTASAATLGWCIHRFPVLVRRDGVPLASRATVLELMEEGVLIVDSEGLVVDANPAAMRLLGATEQVVGRPSAVVLGGWPADLAAAGASTARREVRVEERRSRRVLDVLVSPLPGADATTGRAIVMRDATARAAAEARLAHVADHDALTGLPNRRALRRATEAAIARGPAALLLLDLDGFKEVNDTFGHGRGDELLVHVAGRMGTALPADAFAARLGGDEFAILLPGLDERAAIRVAEAVAAVVAEPARIGIGSVRVTASVGVALAPRHGDVPEALERCADVAMYRAKRSRRVVAAYDPEDDPNTPERISLMAALPAAIARRELVVHLQPIVWIGDGTPSGAEALVRWQHPQLGLLAPGRFLPLVEPAGIGRELVREVARQATDALAAWPEGPGLQVGINVSALDLADDELIDDLLGMIARAGREPRHVVLELTEDALLDDPSAVVHLERARAEGLRLALDDFGTGYGSLSLLRDVHGAAIKVARTFVHRVADSPVDQAVLSAIGDVGRRLGQQVVAEGIEDERALVACRALGCTLAQGFHIARPMPVERCRTWLDERSAAVDRDGAAA